MALTKKQRELIELLASDKGVSLYKEQSMSGQSETLRYRRQWVERSYKGTHLRSESGMVLSVKISLLPDGKDDPEDWREYNAKCEEAQTLFNELRAKAQIAST